MNLTFTKVFMWAICACCGWRGRSCYEERQWFGFSWWIAIAVADISLMTYFSINGVWP